MLAFDSSSHTEALSWKVHSAADLGRALADLRDIQGLKQEELAEMVGITRQYLSNLEGGTSVLVLERLLRAFRRLGADVTVTVRARSEDGVA